MSVLEFAAVYGSAVSVWLGATYVPAASRWRAVERAFLPTLGACAPWLATGAVAVWRYDRFRGLSVGALGDADWRQRHVLSAVLSALLMLVFVLPARVFTYCETHACGGLAPACGASSCSASRSADVYSPRGWFAPGGAGPRALSFGDGRATVCVYRGCDWAGSNNLTVLGYPEGPPGFANASAAACPGCGVATVRAEDYPNPALGNRGGVLLGLNTSVSAAPCPGVRVVPGAGALVPRSVCGYCGPYRAKHQGAPLPGHCPARFAADNATGGIPTNPALAEDDWIVCALLCPSPQEDSSPRAMGEELVSAALAVVVMVAEAVVQEALLPPAEKSLADAARAVRAVFAGGVAAVAVDEAAGRAAVKLAGVPTEEALAKARRRAAPFRVEAEANALTILSKEA